MRIQQLMTRAVWTCQPSDGLDAAVRIMRDHSCGCVVVVDEADRPLGVVTDRDACLCALRTLRPLQMIRVAEAMSGQPAMCRPEDPIARAEEMMSQRQVRRLPIVDDRGCLVGILSIDDLAREAARLRDPATEPVTPDEVGRTLGVLAKPRIAPRP